MSSPPANKNFSCTETLPGNKAIQAQGALPLSYVDRLTSAIDGGTRTRDLLL
jgi:hypothetical protein